MKLMFTIGCVFCLIFTSMVSAQEKPAKVESIRVMSFNLWHGGDDGKQPLEKTAAVIKAGKADIVGLQETHGHAPQKDAPRPDHAVKLAAMLGWQSLPVEFAPQFQNRPIRPQMQR